MKANNRKYLVIVNPISGGTSPSQIISRIESQFEENNNCKYEIHASKKKGDIERIARENIGNGFDVYVVVGGDGTVNEVASIITGTEIALCIIPKGSGNGLYNSLYGKIKLKQAISRIISFNKIQKVNTGHFGKCFFVNVAGVGFDGLITKLFENSQKRGLITYMKLIAINYFSYKPIFFEIKVENIIKSGRYLSVCIANGKEAGNRFIINPNGKMDDDKMELCLIKKPSILEFPFIFLKFLFKDYDFTQYIEYISAKNFLISTNKTVFTHCDGNFQSEIKTNISFCINTKYLNVVSD